MSEFTLDQLAPRSILLEDRLGGNGGLLFADPREIVRCDRASEAPAALERLERGLADGLHAAGLLSYELAYALEPRLAPLTPRRRHAPLLWFGLFDAPLRIEAEQLDAAFASLPPSAPITGLAADASRADHVRRVEQALRLIAAGDVYQVNLTFPIRFRYAGDPLRLYAALRARQPVAHGGFAALDEATVLSVSPELWIDVADGEATTRPMKGTAARAADPAADRAARLALAADPKQRSENLMIVDLLRNDLARVSAIGSVRVPALFTVETYPDLHTLTSTVVGRVDAQSSLKDLICALFPCGSVVGAPKIRAAEIIRALEPSPRGFYTGALGAIAPSGDLRFNVAIRTAVLATDGTGCYGVGGGIVADSDPDAEYDEALLKARVLTDLADDYGLIETFRWSADSGFLRLERHLRRLSGSAARLGFAFDPGAAAARLERCAAGWETGDRRVRLQLARCGALEIASQPDVAPPTRLLVGVAAHRLDPADPFLRHKTTRRARFEQAFAAAAAEGLDEAIFLNLRGEIAEASRNTVFVELGGRLVTPPLRCGVLPGVLREALLDAGEAVEGVVALDDLLGAPAWLGNSLHGLRPARLA